MKLPSDLCVCAPQYLELSTSRGPKASVSVLVPAILVVVLNKAADCPKMCVLLIGTLLCRRGEAREEQRKLGEQLFMLEILRSCDLKACALRVLIRAAIATSSQEAREVDLEATTGAEQLGSRWMSPGTMEVATAEVALQGTDR